MKLSTKLHAVAAGLTTFGLGIAGISLYEGALPIAATGALMATAGAAIDAAAHVIEASGNGAQ